MESDSRITRSNKLTIIVSDLDLWASLRAGLAICQWVDTHSSSLFFPPFFFSNGIAHNLEEAAHLFIYKLDSKLNQSTSVAELCGSQEGVRSQISTCTFTRVIQYWDFCSSTECDYFCHPIQMLIQIQYESYLPMRVKHKHTIVNRRPPPHPLVLYAELKNQSAQTRRVK